MKTFLFISIFLTFSYVAKCQTNPYSEKCTVCTTPVLITASKKGQTYYLTLGAHSPDKIGSKLSTENAVKAYGTALAKKLATFCGRRSYLPSVFVNFVNDYSQRAVIELAPRKTAAGTPIMVESVGLDNGLYLALIRIGPSLYNISLLGAHNPVDLLTWNSSIQQYQFNVDALKNQSFLLNHLPELQLLKDSIAKIDYPNLYLLHRVDSTYELIISNEKYKGIHSGITLTDRTGSDIIMAGRTLVIDSTSQTVNAIKTSPMPPKKNSARNNDRGNKIHSVVQSVVKPLDSAARNAKSMAKKIADSTSITILTAANFDFSGKLSASYLGLLNIFAPHIHGSMYGFIAGIEKINYSPGNINGNDSSQTEYFVQNYIPNPLNVNRLNSTIVSGSKYVQQYNQYTYTASNTVWSFYFQPTWKLLPLNDLDDRQGLFFHLHAELLVNEWTRTANIKTLTQSDSLKAGNFMSDSNFYWVQKNAIISNYNFISPYFGCGFTLFVDPFSGTSGSYFFGQATFGLAYNTPNFQELNNPIDRPQPNGTYSSNNITNPRKKGFFLLRFSFTQSLSTKSTLEVGTVLRGIYPTSTPQYAAFLGLNIDLNALAGLITGK